MAPVAPARLSITNGLTEALLQLGRDGPGDHVGGAARRERHDDRDRLVGIGGVRRGDETHGEHGGDDPLLHVSILQAVNGSATNPSGTVALLRFRVGRAGSSRNDSAAILGTGSAAGARDDREPDVDDALGDSPAFGPVDDEAGGKAADRRAVDANRGQCGMDVRGRTPGRRSRPPPADRERVFPAPAPRSGRPGRAGPSCRRSRRSPDGAPASR